MNHQEREAGEERMNTRLDSEPMVEVEAVTVGAEYGLGARRVRVMTVNEAEVVTRDMDSRGWFEHFEIDDFRARFTRVREGGAR
jgi:hypothetical protein